MDPIERHALAPHASFDGGDLDCGNGLLLLIRGHIDPLRPGQLLEIRSTETSVDEDLPAWCRMTGNELVSFTRGGRQRSFLVRKAGAAEGGAAGGETPRTEAAVASTVPAVAAGVAAPEKPRVRRAPVPAAPAVVPLSVFGIGSWPRPRWLLQALHERLEGRLSEVEFEATADDAVRLAVGAQRRAGVDVLTDGEQRRDGYASFVGSHLSNCRMIPLTDLLPLVDDPERLAAEFRSLDVPADRVRHPAVFGPLSRREPFAVGELEFLRTLSPGPVKVAIPGPYLLSRILWLECVSEKAYPTREALAQDVVKVLREELFDLLDAGASIVQFDEPVLTEVVHAGRRGGTTFMCGALSERGEAEPELAFARELFRAVTAGAPRERLAIHVCRGNWTPDESAALTGDYGPLVAHLSSLDVGAYLLELCTPRAGEMEVLRGLPDSSRIGVGVVNPKSPTCEEVGEIEARVRRAVALFGRDRVLVTTDCGFATFSDNPVCTAPLAEQKLAAMSAAVLRVR